MIGVKKIKKGQIETYTTADIADSVNKRYQTDSQQLYNDATSSIQTQLGTKQTYLVKDSVPTSAVTGTTALTQVGASILIPANTFNAIDAFFLDSFGVLKTGTNSTCNWRLHHNTTDTLIGASTILTSQLSTGASTSGNTKREFEINGGFLKCRMLGTTAAYTDYAASSGVGLSISFDPTINNYFFRTVQLASALDSVLSTQIIILK